ncbi:hypothetical protein ACXYX3_17930 [Mycobacterium sp. C3-094]
MGRVSAALLLSNGMHSPAMHCIPPDASLVKLHAPSKAPARSVSLLPGSGGKSTAVIAAVTLASFIAGCASAERPAGTTVTETVTMTAPLVADPAPIKLPAGSHLHDRGVDNLTGAWADVWYLPESMTADEVLAYLRGVLPVGRPFEDAPGSHLEWCVGGPTSWSWQKVGGGDQPDVIDRLAVFMISDHIVKISRDADKPFDCSR